MLEKKTQDQICAHAEREFPKECCGLVYRSSSDFSERKVFECRNVQDLYHKKDPKQFPRTSETAFILDSKKFLETEVWAKENNFLLEFIYHSHVNCESYFSEEDKKFARSENDYFLETVKYLVVSVIQKRAKDFSIYSWCKNNNTFLRTTIVIQ